MGKIGPHPSFRLRDAWPSAGMSDPAVVTRGSKAMGRYDPQVVSGCGPPGLELGRSCGSTHAVVGRTIDNTVSGLLRFALTLVLYNI